MHSPAELFRRCVVALLLFCSGAATLAQTDSAPSAVRRAMRDAADAMARLEVATAAKKSPAVLAEARTFAGIVRAFDFAAVAATPQLRAALEARAAAAREDLKDLEAAAAGDRIDDAVRAQESLRRDCVRCHLATRPAEEVVGAPARLGAVLGAVTVRTLAGDLRAEPADVVVFLDGASDAPAAPPLRAPRISQESRRFRPRVLPVVRGTTVEFPNDDCCYHNIFSLSPTKPFDLGSYDPGSSRSVTFDRTGLVKIFCNLHPEMTCSVVILSNAHFAVTDAAGSFVIPEVPDGAYALRAWNEFGGETRGEITVGGRVARRVDLEIRETRADLRHTNKFGRPYREKYR